ncbi:MAG: DUF4013 domain-containing protein [Anaerolineales bacterium]
MEGRVTTDHLKTIIIFPFQDERWVSKLLVACVWVFLGFIPVLPYILLLGYVALIILEVVEEGEPALPAWDDLSRIFTHGSRLFGVGFVFFLPFLLLMVLGYGVMILSIFSMESNLISEGVGIFSVLGSYLAGFGLIGLGVLLAFGTSVFLPVAGCHAVVERDFSAGFRFKEWWPIFRANWDGFLISFVLLFGGGMVAYYATQFLVFTVVLCCLYPIVMGVLSVYLLIVGAALFAQAYRTGREEVTVAAA